MSISLSIASTSPWTGLLAGLGTAAVGWALWPGRNAVRLAPPLILIAGAMLILKGSIWPRFVSTPSWPNLSAILSLTQMAWVCVLVIWFARRHSRRAGTGTVVFVLIVGFTSSAMVVWATPDPAIDVMRFHDQATAVLMEGGNPYTDIEVQEDYRPEKIVHGYVYPPVPLLSFTASAIVGLDVRYATLAAWAAALAILGTAALRSSDRTTSVGILILLAAQPEWPGILILGWTEPLALLWLTVGLLCIRSRPFLSAVAIGLAVASKQYYIAVLPMFITMRWHFRWRRIGLILLAAAATVAPFAIRSPAGFIDATIGYVADLPVRTDTANLIGWLDFLGIQFTPSKWMAPLAASAVAAFAGKNAATIRHPIVGVGVTLGVVFFLGTQALEGYWFLVLWIVAIAFIVDDHPARDNSDGSSDEPLNGDESSTRTQCS